MKIYLRKLLVLSVLFTGLVCPASAQYFDKYYSFGPAYSMPLSNRSYISKPTVRSGKFSYRELLNERVSAGVDLSVSMYDDYIPPQVYQSGNQAVYTDFYPYTTQYGLALSGEYLFRPEAKLIPYVGFSAGAAFTSMKLYYNIYDNSATKWAPLLRPYGGAMLRLGSNTSWGAFACAFFDQNFVRSEDYGYKGLSSLSLQAGLVYLNW